MKTNIRIWIALILIVGSLVSMGMVSAESETYKVGVDNNLQFLCTLNGEIPSIATTYNISVYYSNGTALVLNDATTAQGQGSFNYTLLFPEVGDYKVKMFCTDGVYSFSDEGKYIITPSGSLMNDGDSLVLFGSLLVMIILSTVFLFIAFKTENLPGRITLYTVSFIGFMMSVLYTVITIQQILFGFDSIINGIETFLFVGKIGFYLGFVILMIVVFLIMLKAWKIKRGFDD